MPSRRGETPIVFEERDEISYASTPPRRNVRSWIIGAILVILVLSVGTAFWKNTHARGYSALFLASGDIYFGKLSTFPRLKLTDVWYLSRTVNQSNEQQLSVIPFRNSFWGPQDVLYPNRNEVLFVAPLRDDSELARRMANPASFQDSQDTSSPSNSSPAASPNASSPAVVK